MTRVKHMIWFGLLVVSLSSLAWADFGDPLPGLSATDLAQATLLHDGRATTLSDAILDHAGQATAARANFVALNQTQKNKLLAFLNSL